MKQLKPLIPLPTPLVPAAPTPSGTGSWVPEPYVAAPSPPGWPFSTAEVKDDLPELPKQVSTAPAPIPPALTPVSARPGRKVVELSAPAAPPPLEAIRAPQSPAPSMIAPWPFPTEVNVPEAAQNVSNTPPALTRIERPTGSAPKLQVLNIVPPEESVPVTVVPTPVVQAPAPIVAPAPALQPVPKASKPVVEVPALAPVIRNPYLYMVCLLPLDGGPEQTIGVFSEDGLATLPGANTSEKFYLLCKNHFENRTDQSETTTRRDLGLRKISRVSQEPGQANTHNVVSLCNITDTDWGFVAQKYVVIKYKANELRVNLTLSELPV